MIDAMKPETCMGKAIDRPSQCGQDHPTPSEVSKAVVRADRNASAVSRREILRAGAAAAGAALLPSLSGYFGQSQAKAAGADASSGPSQPDRPNIVLIILDTVRVDHLSCYGHRRETTPNIDALAKGARVYKNVLSPSCYTLPVHASMFTGFAMSAHGSCWSHWYLEDEFPILAEQLQKSGYQTPGLSSSSIFVCQRTGLARGFEPFWIPSGTVQADDGSIRSQANRLYRAKAMNERFSQWLESEYDRKKPFFLFMNYFDAHQPYTSPPKARHFAPEGAGREWESEKLANIFFDYSLTGFDVLSQEQIETLKALYDDAIRYVDAKVGEVFAALKKAGLDKNTAILITSDHGDQFGEHHMMSHQFSLYEPLVRVPLIAHWPKKFEAGTEERLVQCHDVYPTILELAGVEWERKPGQTCESLLRPLSDGRYGISEYTMPFLAPLGRVAHDYPRVDTSRFSRRLRVIQRENMKLVSSSDGQLELYDLANDPQEARNLVSDRSSLVRELSAELEAWRKSSPLYAAGRRPLDRKVKAENLSDKDLDAMRGLGY